jgi:membrane protease YdiL (CAAX protease family)
MIPYVMIHFGKPLPETLGAIIAGLVLGHLALKSRSVWLGIATHVIVATSMDFAALLRRGYFG